MECDFSEPFEIKPEADSADISECDDKPSIGMFVIYYLMLCSLHLPVYCCCSLFVTCALRLHCFLFVRSECDDKPSIDMFVII